MKITTKAKVTERNKTSIHNVLSGNAKFAKRGPKKELSEKDVKHLVRTLKAMEDTTFRVIQALTAICGPR